MMLELSFFLRVIAAGCFLLQGFRATSTTDRSACFQQPERGPCKAYFERWYYNSERRKCERFIYGGCKGNTNNFETRENCEGHCGVGGCFDDANPTGCSRTPMRRWRYKIKNGVGKCRRFRWNGCPSENVFEKKRQCKQTCENFLTEDLCPVFDCGLDCPKAYAKDNDACIVCRCMNPCTYIRCGQDSFCDPAVGTCVPNPCVNVTCGLGPRCDPFTGECRCPENQVLAECASLPSCTRCGTTQPAPCPAVCSNCACPEGTRLDFEVDVCVEECSAN